MSEPMAPHIDQKITGESRTEFMARFVARPAFIQIKETLELKDLNQDELVHLVHCFCHRSFLNESELELSSYERYEFLGDALIELMVTEILYQKYPSLSEGELSKLRSSLVCEEALVELMSVLPFSELILIGKGERKRDGHLNPTLCADVFEAFLGAVYLAHNRNFHVLRELFLKLVNFYNQKNNLDYFSSDKLINFDSKTKFQELVMKKGLGHPTYDAREIDESTFEVSLVINKKIVKRLVGYSKKKTEKELATWALAQGEDLFASVLTPKGEEDATS